MQIRYRGHSLDLRFTQESLTIRGRDGAAKPINVCVNGKGVKFKSGMTRVFGLEKEKKSDGPGVKEDLDGGLVWATV